MLTEKWTVYKPRYYTAEGEIILQNLEKSASAEAIFVKVDNVSLV